MMHFGNGDKLNTLSTYQMTKSVAH